MKRHPHPLPRHLLALLLAGAGVGAQAAGGFPAVLSENTTPWADSFFVGAPDDIYRGLSSNQVTFDFGELVIVNRDGAVDLNVYEYDTTTAEFNLVTVLVSQNGIDFTSVEASESPLQRITGDSAHARDNFGRSYDLGDLSWARYVRLQGTGSGTGNASGFDLDAIGAHELMAPVPEPSTAALWLAGAAVIGSLARRRRR